MAYSWPGNVRELQNVLKCCMVIGNWKEVTDNFSMKNRSSLNSMSAEPSMDGASIVDNLLNFKGEYSSDRASFSLKKITKKVTDRTEKEVISFVLDKTDWNRTKASKILKIDYKTLLYKISNLDIK